MSDINLLSSAGPPPKDEKPSGGPKPLEDELKLHVPDPEPLLAEPKPLPAPPKPKPSPLPVVAPLKLSTNPSAPKPAPPRPVPPPPAPPKPPPPRPPPPPPPKPPEPPKPAPEEKGSGTLRVSLIASGAGAGMSEIALRRKLRTLGLVALLGVVLDGLIFGGLYYYRSTVERRNAQAEQTVRDVDARILAREKELAPVRDFQGLAKAAATVLKNHEHWTLVLKFLEERALPEVQFGGLSGADTGSLSFEVNARDYATLGKQIIAFRQDARVRKVTIGGVSAAFAENNLLKGTRASMTLMVDPTMLDYAPPTSSATSTR